MNDEQHLNEKRQGYALVQAALTALVVAVAFLFPLHSLDIWWHLDSGRWMLQHHQYLGHETRTFSLNGAPWHNFSWLFQVVVALLYQWLGMWGLLLFKAVLMWLLFMLMFVAIGHTAAPFNWLLVSLLFGWQIIPHILLRPHLLEGVFLALVLYWLQREPRRGDIARYALLILLWANIHASVVVGVAALSLHYVVGPACVRRPLAHWSGRLVPTLLLVLLMFATPNGWHLLDVLIGHAQGDYMHSYIKEWHKPVYFPLLSASALAAILIAALLRLRILRPAEWFLIAFFLLLSFGSQRFLFESGLVLMRPCGQLTGLLLARAGRASPRLAGRNGWVAGGLLLLGSLSFYKVPFAWQSYTLRDYPVAMRLYPHVAMSVLQPLIAARGRLKLWNAYGWGGYIGWRSNGRVKVFIDGRTPSIFSEPMLVTSTLSSRNPRLLSRLASVWQVEAILLRAGQNTLLTAYAPRWRLVAYDQRSMLYLRSDLAERYHIQSLGFNPFRPIGRYPPQRLKACIHQLRWLLARDQENALAWLHLSDFLGQLQSIDPTAQRESELLDALQHAIDQMPHRLQARMRLAIRLQILGRSPTQVIQPVLPAVWRASDKERSMYAISLAQMFIRAGHLRDALRVMTFDEPGLQLQLDRHFISWLLRLKVYLALGDEAAATKVNQVLVALALTAPAQQFEQYQALLARSPQLAGGH